MNLTFSGEIWHWRGPAPHHFVTVPPSESELIAELSPLLTYGWGMIPVEVNLDGHRASTALWPKDGGYIVPLKKDLREAAGADVGDWVQLTLRLAIDQL